MRHYIIAIAGVILLSTCGKMEQRQETSFTCTVTDITTGTMTEKAKVYLYEYYTPSKPFSNIERTLIEYFEMDYGEPFSYEFNAKRGDGYEYVLEFQNASWYANGYIDNDRNLIESIESCTLSKKNINEYELHIVPTSRVKFDGENPSDVDAKDTDSLSVRLKNYQKTSGLDCSGIGGCPEGGGEIPHGWYEYSYEIYRDGVLEEAHAQSLYIKHRADTTLFVSF